MTDDIYNAFCEATIDTFDALRKSPQLNDPTVVKELDTSYVFLKEVTGVSPQVLFDNISKGAHDLIQASDHVMLVSGTHPRELTCDTCGRLVSHHGDQGAYKQLLTAVQDIEAIAALSAADAKARGSRG
jgi:hypothetical protein